MKRHLIFCLAFYLPLCLSGQKQAAFWFLGNSNGVDFTGASAEKLNNAPSGSPYAYGTYSDENGKLVLYTDGQRLWNGNHEMIANALTLEGWSVRPSSIIPKPGSDSLFYIFTSGVYRNTPSGTDEIAMFYSIADMSKDAGKGEVIEKRKVLYYGDGGYGGNYTISSNCSGDFWLIGSVLDDSLGREKFLVFSIDSTGIHEPLAFPLEKHGYSHSLKIAPSGDRLYFSFSASPRAAYLADFNPVTGVISHYKAIPDGLGGRAEFSPDGSMLYLFRDSTTWTNLRQIDLRSPALPVLYTSTFHNQVLSAQLAPDKRIYFMSYDSRIGFIANPDVRGPGCGFSFSDPFEFENTLQTRYLPEYPNQYFYSDAVKANAGTDIEVCANDTARLGGVYQDRVSYVWSPAEYLDDPTDPRPIFRNTGNVGEPAEKIYTLTARDQYCFSYDEVSVTSLPRPEASVIGPKSVCPAVEEVDYTVESATAVSYLWEVSGGVIVTGQTTDSVEVDWGSTNDDAFVIATVVNDYQCPTKMLFPVRINPVLETEMPNGLDTVCFNARNANTYFVTKATGSDYHWEISGGDIVLGNGTHVVNINWAGLGSHGVWVTETSVTRDTVCFGTSDTLEVKVSNDSLRIVLDLVSIDPENEDQARIESSIVPGAPDAGISVELLRKPAGMEPWRAVVEVNSPLSQVHLADPLPYPDSLIYEYHVLLTDRCGDLISSETHNTVRLSAMLRQNNVVELSWNPYNEANFSPLRIELMRKKDDEGSFRLLSTLSWEAASAHVDGSDGFDHTFLLKIISAEGNVAYSNSVFVHFDHPIFIPNIFTPNGDGLNDSFAIRNIHLYGANEILVYNRYGEIVYHRTDYDGTWDAEELSGGTYFYLLKIPETKQQYRGWVTIMR